MYCPEIREECPYPGIAAKPATEQEELEGACVEGRIAFPEAVCGVASLACHAESQRNL